MTEPTLSHTFAASVLDDSAAAYLLLQEFIQRGELSLYDPRGRAIVSYLAQKPPAEGAEPEGFEVSAQFALASDQAEAEEEQAPAADDGKHVTLLSEEEPLGQSKAEGTFGKRQTMRGGIQGGPPKYNN